MPKHNNPDDGPIRCDFCSNRELVPIRKYLTDGYTYTVELGGRRVTANVAPEWWACVPCVELIDGGHKEALADRALKSNPSYPGFIVNAWLGEILFLRGMIEGFHNSFFEHRIGA